MLTDRLDQIGVSGLLAAAIRRHREQRCGRGISGQLVVMRVLAEAVRT
eukprot:COSAG02_NODE_653_length_18827_cov_44.237826_6_plen_48_part_00